MTMPHLLVASLHLVFNKFPNIKSQPNVTLRLTAWLKLQKKVEKKSQKEEISPNQVYFSSHFSFFSIIDLRPKSKH